MKEERCPNCGSIELERNGSSLRCPYCGTNFKQELKGGTVISLGSDIEILLEKCKKEPLNARRYANRVLDIDPDNEEALKYL